MGAILLCQEYLNIYQAGGRGGKGESGVRKSDCQPVLRMLTKEREHLSHRL